jgi:AcrR family transcriptional regulator
MRKQPKQQRSRALVATLLDATARCIARDGFEGTTVPKLCEEAGVSVGSFYQYFEHKDQLYDALMDRMIDTAVGIIDTRLSGMQGADTDQVIRVLLDSMWTMLEGDRGVYREVVRHWTQLSFGRGIVLLEQKIFEVLTLHLLDRPRAEPVRRLPYRLYILSNAMLFTFIRYISEPPVALEREKLFDELAQLMRDSLDPVRG